MAKNEIESNFVKNFFVKSGNGINKTKRKEQAYTFLLASGLLVIVIMVLAVFAIVIINGLPYFWLKKIARIELVDNEEIIGEIVAKETSIEEKIKRFKVKIGNRKNNGRDFIIVDRDEIKTTDYPSNYLVFERLEWGNAYGYIEGLDYRDFKKKVSGMNRTRRKIERFEQKHLVNLFEKLDKMEKRLAKKGDESLTEKYYKLKSRYLDNEKKAEAMYEEAKKEVVTITIADGEESDFLLFDVVHVYRPNALNVFQKTMIMFYKMLEFIFADPRESNTEGGVAPAIFGTVLLVFLMSIFVFPLGVITAVFLSEYAKEGILLQAIRITIFNLAGVPSIVYGVFGLGFFVYGMGNFIDHTFFQDNLPVPTFGSGGMLWASLTLAVLTLPVVVVASLEGLRSVPRIYREGAFALSATKWEVIKDVVIPNAMPGMLTGLILAISRAAGEVAPLMLTGVVKSAPALPIDGKFPFIHLERKFMHLGFHIYDVGFQSPNIEAARPMVFNTTLLLLVLVFILNLAAIIIRNKMWDKLKTKGL